MKLNTCLTLILEYTEERSNNDCAIRRNLQTCLTLHSCMVAYEIIDEYKDYNDNQPDLGKPGLLTNVMEGIEIDYSGEFLGYEVLGHDMI